MNKLTKGAFSMVLAGTVTFSVTNALLGDQSSKLVPEENAFTITEDQKNVDETMETMKDQTPATNEIDEQTDLTSNDAPIQVALNDQNENDVAIAAIPQNTKEGTEGTATKTIHTNQTTTSTPAAPSTPKPTSPPPATSTPAPPTTTSPPPTGNNVTSAANYGQEVAQAAKEKAESPMENKGNNGKKN